MPDNRRYGFIYISCLESSREIRADFFFPSERTSLVFRPTDHFLSP